MRGVAEHDYEIAWVDDAWRIRSERLHAIDRDDIAPPQIDTLDLSDSLGGIDIEAPVEETEDAVDEFAPIVRDLSEGEMRSAVRSIVTLLNAGQGDEAWERYASDDLKASVGGFPTMMTDGGISLRSQSFDGNVATVEVVRSDGFGQQEHRLRLTFAEGADPKITKLTVE